MDIKVLGMGCSSCKNLYLNTKKALENLGIYETINLEKIEDINRIMDYNIITMPALVIDDKVVMKGKVLTVKEIEDIIGSRISD